MAKVAVVYLDKMAQGIPIEGYTFETVVDKLNKAQADDLVEFGMGPTPVAFFKRDVVLVGVGMMASPVEGRDELERALATKKPH